MKPTQKLVQFSHGFLFKIDLNIFLKSILCLILLLITINNFPSHFLSGWDNIHSEFNPLLNISRALSDAYQHNQGLGTYGGHGYSAILPHAIIALIFSFIPQELFRAIFTFAMYGIGSFGMYELVKLLLLNHTHNNSLLKNHLYVSSFFAGLFYILNFGTIQIFFVQLESFIVHFAVLPWSIYLVINLITKGKKVDYIKFILLSFFASVQGFIPPLFIMYSITLGIFLLSLYLSSPSQLTIKRIILVLIIVLCTNIYWLSSVLSYSIQNSGDYLNSYINSISTDDFILKTKAYGNIENIHVLKSFIFDTRNIDELGNTVQIAPEWQVHLAKSYVKTIGYVFFSLILLGLVYIVRFIKKPFHVAIILGTLVSFSLLATDIPLFSTFQKVLHSFPIIKQSFRIAFTKVSISLAFYYSILLGFGIYWILNIFKKNFLRYTILIVLVLTLIINSYPVFSGNLFYKDLDVDIPQQYFQASNYINNSLNINEKILLLPVGWNWGWSVYSWGYSGSGFLWYDIENPVIDRAFDAWSSYNEQLYWELYYALYSERYDIFTKVLNKYRISYILFDPNYIPYQNVKSQKFADNLKSYLETDNFFEIEQEFKGKEISKNLLLIKYKPNQNYSDNSILEHQKIVNMDTIWQDVDIEYITNGDYISSNDQQFARYRVNNKLFSKRSDQVNNIVFNDDSQDFSITTTLSNNPIYITKNLKVYDSKNDYDFLNHTRIFCNPNQIDNISQSFKNGSILFSSFNNNTCYDIGLPTLSHSKSYAFVIDYNYVSGKSLRSALINFDSQHADLDIYLPKDKNRAILIQPPMKNDGLGYTLHFDNSSIGSVTTKNLLVSVKVYEFPYQDLVNTYFQKNNDNSYNTFVSWYAFDSAFSAALKSDDPSVASEKLSEHVLVNNWANGWIISDDQKACINNGKCVVKVSFWPQTVQNVSYIFGLLGILGVMLYVQKSQDGSEQS